MTRTPPSSLPSVVFYLFIYLLVIFITKIDEIKLFWWRVESWRSTMAGFDLVNICKLERKVLTQAFYILESFKSDLVNVKRFQMFDHDDDEN